MLDRSRKLKSPSYPQSVAHLLIAMVLLVPVQSQAVDKNGHFAIWGKGGKSCYSYTKARNAEDVQSYKDYIMGYLTASNLRMEDTYSISAQMNINDILAWLDSYCETKPMISVEQSLTEFTITHYEKRAKRAPHRYNR